MSIDETASRALLPVPGVRVAAACAGIRQQVREDVALFELAADSDTHAVFTRNAFRAAPVQVAQRHLSERRPRYLLINSGNANAGTGAQGLEDARDCAAAVARSGACDPAEVLPFSTGVIGARLPVERITALVPRLVESLDEAGWKAAARAILTTDTATKTCSVDVGDMETPFRITGIAKGAGMIHPDMATMLAFLATDLPVHGSALQECLRRAVQETFNCITVDGDTSTNDACVLTATGRAAATPLTSIEDPRFPLLLAHVTTVCERLALAIIDDGEGATKRVRVDVSGGRTVQECRAVAHAVALSPLVKTALFAADPNWGRIVAAIGRAPVEALDVQRITLHLGPVCVFEDGAVAPNYSEQAAREVMSSDAFVIAIGLARGEASATVHTCDLSSDYVRINAEYRT